MNVDELNTKLRAQVLVTVDSLRAGVSVEFKGNIYPITILERMDDEYYAIKHGKTAPPDIIRGDTHLAVEIRDFMAQLMPTSLTLWSSGLGVRLTDQAKTTGYMYWVLSQLYLENIDLTVCAHKQDIPIVWVVDGKTSQYDEQRTRWKQYRAHLIGLVNGLYSMRVVE